MHDELEFTPIWASAAPACWSHLLADGPKRVGRAKEGAVLLALSNRCQKLHGVAHKLVAGGEGGGARVGNEKRGERNAHGGSSGTRDAAPSCTMS